MLAWLPTSDLWQRDSSWLTPLSWEHAAGSTALGRTLSPSLSSGEVVGACGGDVGPKLWVPPARLWSLVVDATAVLSHLVPYWTAFKTAGLPFSRFSVKNFRTLSKVVTYWRERPATLASTSIWWSFAPSFVGTS